MFPRSNRIRVARSTYRHIAAGDAARTAGDWPAAAVAYREALAREPMLTHLWVQLGHALKENGQYDRAEAAYTRAAAVDTTSAEPFLHMGHMAKSRSRPIDALRHVVDALQRAPDDLAATAELVRLLPARDRLDAESWDRAVACLSIDPATIARHAEPLPSDVVLCDVTDLVAYFAHRRLPTGIQRVQLEISLASQSLQLGGAVAFCVYTPSRGGWLRVPTAMFADLCRASLASADVTDPMWVDRLVSFYRWIAVAQPTSFTQGRLLLNLGTSWNEPTYLRDVDAARRTYGIVYVAFVFDVIPLLRPDWFVPSLVADFTRWATALLATADGLLAISESTRRDLLAAAAEMGRPITTDVVRVVPLDGDPRVPSLAPDLLVDRELPKRFVLMVSTIEPRKNHLGAFRAWRRLLDTLGPDRTPLLVCVGGPGWLNGEVHRLLADDPELSGHVAIRSNVADDELALLYASCLFVLYPSFYEGWGLPVSEALAHGKVPAVARTSSMPEAGGRFARYFDPADAMDIARAAAELLDEDLRRVAEAEIAGGYRPRTWGEIAQQAFAEARQIALSAAAAR